MSIKRNPYNFRPKRWLRDILPGIYAWASKSRYSCMENLLKRRGFTPLIKRVNKIKYKGRKRRG